MVRLSALRVHQVTRLVTRLVFSRLARGHRLTFALFLLQSDWDRHIFHRRLSMLVHNDCKLSWIAKGLSLELVSELILDKVPFLLAVSGQADLDLNANGFPLLDLSDFDLFWQHERIAGA